MDVEVYQYLMSRSGVPAPERDFFYFIMKKAPCNAERSLIMIFQVPASGDVFTNVGKATLFYNHYIVYYAFCKEKYSFFFTVICKHCYNLSI